jgi:hypothetical protein
MILYRPHLPRQTAKPLSQINNIIALKLITKSRANRIATMQQLEAVLVLIIQTIIVFWPLLFKTRDEVSTPRYSESQCQKVAKRPAVPTTVAKKRPVPKPRSIAKSSLYKLPSKIRGCIFENVVRIDDNRTCEITWQSGIPEPPLLFTCKIIRKEATAAFYGVNNFRAVVDSLHPGVLVLIERKNKSLKASGVFLRKDRSPQCVDLSYWYLSSNEWHNLRLWLQYVHAGELDRPNMGRESAGKLLFRYCETRVHTEFVKSLFKIAAAMDHRPWAEVGGIIDDLHQGLVDAA